MTALCPTRPAEWWETGHDGNRLALVLCGVCPQRDGTECLAGRPDPTPYGVIRAGVAYGDTGKALPVCHCGYPHTTYRGGDVTCCPWCSVEATHWHPPSVYVRLRVDEQAVERLCAGEIPERVRRVDRKEAMRRLWSAGLSHREVAERLRMEIKAVRKAYQRVRA